MPAPREGDDVPATGSGSPPVALQVATWAAVLQAAALVVFAAVVVVHAVRGDRSSVSNAALLAVLLLVWAAGLGLVARGLLVRRRWARAPMLVSGLLLVAAGVPLVQGDEARWAGVLLVVTSLVGVVAVLMPAVTAELDG